MATKLRPYQSKAVADIRRALSRKRSVVLQMPTGAGKTRAATEIVSTVRGGVWFVCHRQEIIRQAGKAFAAAGIDFGVISPRNDFEPEKRIQIASVQTLKNRLRDLPEPKTVIWDECHHVAAKSWSKIREALPNARHVGLTATPERLDGKGLSEWFDTLICGPGVGDLIKQRYLSDFRYFAPSEPDLRKAKITAGDYNKSDIAKIMNTPVLIGDAVDEYLSKAAGKRALAFCSSVDASKSLVRRFKRKGIAAVHVDGTTPTDERDQAVADLESGKIKVLSNVEVFTEGFDVPVIDAVILLRPTKSLMLFRQMVGRSLRVARGKGKALILDHAGLHMDHGFPDEEAPWSLDGGARRARIASLRESGGGYLRRCPECKEVYRERVEVCDCGHMFESGREIGKHDGRLYELRSTVPEGCVTVAEFAERLGLAARALYRIVGLQRVAKGLIDVDQTLKYLREHPPKGIAPLFVHDSENYETPQAFSRRYGVASDTVRKWARVGGFAAPNGWVHVPSGMKWVKTSHSSNRLIIFDEVDKVDILSRSEFGRRVGCSHKTVSRCVARGMPVKRNGMIPFGAASIWYAQNWHPSDVAPKDVPDPESYESGTNFAKRNGVSQAMIKHLIKKGLPVARNKWVHTKKGDAWMLAYNGKMLAPRGVDNPMEYEPVIAFARRLGFRSNWSVREWAKRGLPRSSNGWVHIQRGLEWVRDNTNIKIPDSAWPKGARETLQAAE